MKPKLLSRDPLPDRSFSLNHHHFPHFLKVWHYHPELELVYVVQGHGMRFIGDSIEPFNPGTLLLLGSNLPHMWQSEDDYFLQDSGKVSEALVLHINPSLVTGIRKVVPEYGRLEKLATEAQLGLKFGTRTSLTVATMLRHMLTITDEFDRATLLLDVLARLNGDKDKEKIASQGFVNSFGSEDRERLSRVYDYVLQNFQQQELSVTRVASLVAMNKTAFCRYFKQKTSKTFTEYLNQVRIGFACKRLLDEDQTVLSVSYECGYNNVSHFNRQFRKMKGQSPTDYLHSLKV